MRAKDFITEKWSTKYKRSINCNNPKGFSQRAHCQGRKKTNENKSIKPISIGQSNDGGSLEGYVVSSDQPQLQNYLTSQGAQQELIDRVRDKFPMIAILRNMYIDEDERGQGYGTQLVNDAIDAASYAGANAIILVADTAEQNEFNLISWYEDFGFEIIGDAGGDPVMLLQL